jgi:hypothetical protein
MGYERIKIEHAGAKNRGGAWMTRSEAKLVSRRQRRQAAKRVIAEARLEQRDGSFGRVERLVEGRSF